MVFGLLVFDPPSVTRSANPSARPRQSTRLPSVPVQALGVSVLWLYVIDGTMFSTASLCGSEIKQGDWAPRTGYERSHKS